MENCKGILKELEEAQLLGLFKAFCDNRKTKESQQKYRNIFNRTPDPIMTVKQIILSEFGEEMSDGKARRLYDLMYAFLNKKSYRMNISDECKKKLLIGQNYKCAICGNTISIKDHADHIVPFKYVGDELSDNLQMLCSDCNLEKNASIDFQIRYLLNLTRRN